MKVFVIMIGGFLGSLLRYILGEWLKSESGFPVGTLTVNLIGSFSLGWFLTYISQKHNFDTEFSLLIGTGIIGSFTTFSTFSVETIQLFSSGSFITAIIYIKCSLFLGLSMAYLGYKLAYVDRSTTKGEII